MTANPAPAAMPSEEDVARVLCEARHQMLVSPDQWAAEMAHIREMEAKHPTYITGFSTGTDAVRQARAVLDLFASILAEKERAERTIAARDRRIARLVWAMDYARSQGIVFPADTEPKVVLSEAAGEKP